MLYSADVSPTSSVPLYATAAITITLQNPNAPCRAVPGLYQWLAPIAAPFHPIPTSINTPRMLRVAFSIIKLVSEQPALTENQQ